MIGSAGRLALMWLVASSGCTVNLAARYLTKTGAPICEVELPSRAEIEPPFKVPSFVVELPGEDGAEVLDVLRCCVPSHVFAPLNFGSYSLSVRGGTEDGDCEMLVEAEIEGAYTAYTCQALRPDLWGGWTEGTFPPTEALREHCEVVKERGPG